MHLYFTAKDAGCMLRPVITYNNYNEDIGLTINAYTGNPCVKAQVWIRRFQTGNEANQTRVFSRSCIVISKGHHLKLHLSVHILACGYLSDVH